MESKKRENWKRRAMDAEKELSEARQELDDLRGRYRHETAKNKALSKRIKEPFDAKSEKELVQAALDAEANAAKWQADAGAEYTLRTALEAELAQAKRRLEGKEPPQEKPPVDADEVEALRQELCSLREMYRKEGFRNKVLGQRIIKPFEADKEKLVQAALDAETQTEYWKATADRIRVEKNAIEAGLAQARNMLKALRAQSVSQEEPPATPSVDAKEVEAMRQELEQLRGKLSRKGVTGRPKKYDDKTQQMVKELHESGESIKKIAARLSMSTATVQKLLHNK